MQPAATGPAEIHGLQAMRGFAATAVVLHHALEHSNGAARPFSPDWLTLSGAAGVDVFFVISGFIMLHVSFADGRQPTPPGRFLLLRATRIYPFYWMCFAAMLAIHAAGFLRSHAWTGDEVLTALFLMPTGNQVIGVAWTLTYEIWFYLLFATTLRWGSPRISVVVTTAGIGVALMAAPLLPGGALARFLADPIALEFCMGLGLAWVFRRAARQGRAWQLPAWPMIPAVAVILAAPVAVPYANTAGLPGAARVLAWGLPALVIVACSIALGPPRRIWQRWLVAVGDASYAIYLTHVFAMILYGKALRDTALGALPQPPLVLAVVAVSVILGLVAHRVVEAPLIRSSRRQADAALAPRPLPAATAN